MPCSRRLAPALVALCLVPGLLAGPTAQATLREIERAVDRLASQGVDVSELRGRVATLERQLQASPEAGGGEATPAAPAETSSGMWGKLQWLVSAGVGLVRGIAGSTPKRDAAAPPSGAAPAGLEGMERMTRGLEKTMGALEGRGVDVAQLRRELEAMRPDLEEMRRLHQRAVAESGPGAPPSPAIQREMEVVAKRLKPRAEALGARVEQLAVQAMKGLQEGLQKHFTEKDARELEAGARQLGDFLKGLAAEAKKAGR